jgi:hypothetical protein
MDADEQGLRFAGYDWIHGDGGGPWMIGGHRAVRGEEALLSM